MNLSQKTQKLIIVLIAVNLLAIGFHWVFSRGTKNNIEQLSSLADELNLQLAREKQIQSSKNISKNTKEERTELELYFVSSNDVVDFIKEIEDLAVLSGIDIEIRSVSTEDYFVADKVSSNLEKLTLNLKTTGSWSDNFYFINLLEKMPRKIKFSSLELRASIDTGNGAASWSGTIGLDVLKSK